MGGGMESQAMLGRGIAAVGIGLAFVAIWVQYIGVPEPSKYWDDGTFGGLLLILAILAAVALAAAITTGNREYDLAMGAAGGIGFGLYLFFPAVFAFDQWKFLDAGAWLGLCSALTFIGASLATWPSDRPVAKPSPVGMLLALVGLVLVVAGIFPEFVEGGGSYWSIHGLGHSFGILLIVLVVLEALSIGAAYSMAAGMDSAILIGSVTLGATLAIPVGNAFNNLGYLGSGAWLAGIGGIVLMIGVVAMRQLARGDAPAPAMATPAPPPA
jgi:hypothetical protein